MPEELQIREDDALRSPSERSRSFLRRATLYPAHYACFIALSSLDLLFTWLILCAGGEEENAVANWIIENYNLPGLVLYKFFLVVAVVIICETVGRRRFPTGLRLVRWAVILTAFPVLVGAVHVLRVVGGVRAIWPRG